jgi:hypothetical protein
MEPMTMLSIGQSALGFLEQRKAAREQQARYEANRIAAVAARDLKIQSLNQRAIQESEAVAEDKMALAIKALETKERQKVTAGEAGVAGKSVKQQIALTEARELRGVSKYNASIKNLLTQVELEKAGLNAQAMNRINSMQQGQPPSLIGAVVTGIGAAAAADIKYGDGKMFGIDLKGDINISKMFSGGISEPSLPSSGTFNPSFTSNKSMIDVTTGF